MTQGERVKAIRKALGLTLEKFGQPLGVKKNAISQIENGRNGLTDQMAKAICREFNVNIEWLQNGAGEMFAEINRDDQIAAFVGNLLKDEEDSFKRRLISALAGLDDDGWDFLDQFLDSVQKKKSQE